MKIESGPIVEKYANKFSVPVCEVLDWLHGCINEPEKTPGMECEATERERALSIRAYMVRETG